MKNSTILKRIAATPAPFRRSLRNQAQSHSEAECNGEYYFDEDQNAWVGYTGAPKFEHSTTNAQARKGEHEERDIRAKIMQMCGTKDIPDFIGYGGDPRGFVLKILADKLTSEEVKLCEELDFLRDWGGDFTIVKNNEYKRISGGKFV